MVPLLNTLARLGEHGGRGIDDGAHGCMLDVEEISEGEGEMV